MVPQIFGVLEVSCGCSAGRMTEGREAAAFSPAALSPPAGSSPPAASLPPAASASSTASVLMEEIIYFRKKFNSVDFNFEFKSFAAGIGETGCVMLLWLLNIFMDS